MKLRKQIIEKWSLETEDNYHSLRDKVTFSDPRTYKKHLLVKSISVAFASLVLVCTIVGIAVGFGNNRDFMGGMDAAPSQPSGGSGESFAPEYNKPGVDDENDNVASDGDSEPGLSDKTEGNSEYISFIQNISQNKIDTSSISIVTYIDQKNMYYIKDFTDIANYFNSLKYEKISDDIFENESNYQYQLTINNDWLSIYFNEDDIVAFKYEYVFIEYKVDVDNLYEVLKEFLPN
ncbi:MAG: hypothetical protein IJX78_05550 [Bacilli bacterium]|nr:hypothetical protein [Bacilli bacterium]